MRLELNMSQLITLTENGVSLGKTDQNAFVNGEIYTQLYSIFFAEQRRNEDGKVCIS